MVLHTRAICRSKTKKREKVKKMNNICPVSLPLTWPGIEQFLKRERALRHSLCLLFFFSRSFRKGCVRGKPRKRSILAAFLNTFRSCSFSPWRLEDSRGSATHCQTNFFFFRSHFGRWQGLMERDTSGNFTDSRQAEGRANEYKKGGLKSSYLLAQRSLVTGS